MSSIHLGRLQELVAWVGSHERDKIEKAGLKDEFDELADAVVNRGEVNGGGIETLLRVLPVFEGDVPGEFSEVLDQVRANASREVRERFAADARRFAASYRAALPEGESVSADKPDFVVPMIDDPRAVVLPPVKSPQGDVVFVNGYNAVTREVSLVKPVLGGDGQAKLVIAAVNTETDAKAEPKELKRAFLRDGDTHFFAYSVFEESTVLAVTFGKDGNATRVERYPGYSAAGFEAPFKRSMITTKPQRELKDKPRSFFAKIFSDDDNEYVEIRLFENADGEVDKVTYADLSRGELAKGEGRLFAREYYLMPQLGLKIAFKKKQLAPGISAYQVHVYHDAERRAANTSRSEKRLAPVVLDVTNVDWLAEARTEADRLAAGVAAGTLDVRGLRDAIYAVRDAMGMRVASEVVMRLYYREETHMDAVNALRLDDTAGLPVPPDTRVFPGSRDLVSGLINYFGHNTFSGFVTRQLLASAQEIYPRIPPRYIEGLWLYAAHPTVAEADFLRRGAATPEELTEGYPVGKYRRILDEMHTPLSDSQATRAAQRERVRSIIANEPLNEGFRRYLGYQLDLAQNFDLLLLESGSLYYNNKLVHAIGVTEDGRDLRARVDYNQKIVSIPRAGAAARFEPRPVALGKEDLSKELRMAPHHPDDPFLFTFQARVRGDGGTLDEANMLVRGEGGAYRVPTAAQVYDSMRGLLPLPRDYLAELAPNPEVDLGHLSWTKKEPVTYDLAEKGYGFDEIKLSDFPPFKMIPYEVKVGDVVLEVFLPQPASKLAQELRGKGYYVAGEEDLPKIVKYYMQAVTRKGYRPTRANVYMMPGLIRKDDGGILGFYTWKSEDLVLSSEKVGKENDFNKWASVRFFNTGRHEIAHAIKRGNPWITSLVYRAMALDGFTMDYGVTHLEEYFAVLSQHFFDHPIHRGRFPNGYRLLYTLIKLKEAGVEWDGPNHDMPLPADPTELSKTERNIDGTYGVLRILALGGDPFTAIAAAKAGLAAGGRTTSVGGQPASRATVPSKKLKFRNSPPRAPSSQPPVAAEAASHGPIAAAKAPAYKSLPERRAVETPAAPPRPYASFQLPPTVVPSLMGLMGLPMMPRVGVK